MRKMFRKKLFLVCLLTFMGVLSVFAQDVSFKAFTQSPVIVGQQFRVSYTLTNGDARDFRAPDFAGLDVLMGPSRSTSSSTQIINGTVSSESSVTFTYMLMASKEGTFNIPPATVTSKGKQYSSNAVVIKVLPEDQADKASSAGQGASSAGISAENVFVRAIVSKTNVYEQEAILVTYKLYTRMEIADLAIPQMPDFSGFVIQDVELPQNKQFSMENYKGLNYKTVTLVQRLLYPQRTGEITVGPAEVTAVVNVPNQKRGRGSIFEDFFDTYTTVNKSLKVSGFKVNVKALPAGKPAGFAGAVGDFAIKSSLTPQQPKSNESLTLKIQISGTGNLKYVKTPEVQFPGSFELFDPKVDNNLTVSSAGVSGTKTIEYLAIPRSEGKFTIPAVSFSYFDTKTNSYKMISTPEYNIDVAKGKEGNASQVNNFASKENVKLLGQDIRFIRPEFKLSKSEGYFYGSLLYWLCYILPVIVLGVFFVIYRKRIAENANTSLMKTKKANKVAGKRLKQVAVYLKENKKQEYYDELLKAIWGYISDKLSIPLSELTKDNVQAELVKFGVDQPTIDEIIHILNTCEFARYAPSQDGQMMDKLYNEAVGVINKIESLIKK